MLSQKRERNKYFIETAIICFLQEKRLAKSKQGKKYTKLTSKYGIYQISSERIQILREMKLCALSNSEN